MNEQAGVPLAPGAGSRGRDENPRATRERGIATLTWINLYISAAAWWVSKESRHSAARRAIAPCLPSIDHMTRQPRTIAARAASHHVLIATSAIAVDVAILAAAPHDTVEHGYFRLFVLCAAVGDAFWVVAPALLPMQQEPRGKPVAHVSAARARGRRARRSVAVRLAPTGARGGPPHDLNLHVQAAMQRGVGTLCRLWQLLSALVCLVASAAGFLTNTAVVHWSAQCMRDPRWPEPLWHKLPLALLATQRLVSTATGTAALVLRLRWLPTATATAQERKHTRGLGTRSGRQQSPRPMYVSKDVH
jgi:hypothetical protein